MNQQNTKIFIVGNGRSGTTMLGFVMGRHSQIFSFDELHFFERLWIPKPNETCERSWAIQVVQKLLRIQREDLFSESPLSKFEVEATQIISKLSNEELRPERVFECFLEYETNRRGKIIPCEQTPLNIFYAEEILSLYPEAMLIQMVRDPRDILLSQKNKWKRASLGGNGEGRAIPFFETLRAWANYHPIAIAQLWKNAITAGYKLKDNPRVKTVRFEDITNNPEEVVRDLCNWLKIDFQQDMLNISKVGSSTSSDSTQKVGITKNVGNWKKGGITDTEIKICDNITRAQRALYQYPDANVKVNSILLFFYYCSFPFRFGLAFILNLNRMSSILTSVRRRFLGKY
ncbi:MAG: sulfotransferase [Bacteroidia bacterium]|nr:sulfotransferase [Bacteroidia bacterium]